MSEVMSTEKMFSLSCFEGLRLFRIYSLQYPKLDNVDLLSLIYKLEADAHALNWEAAIYLSSFVEVGCPLDGKEFYRACIKGVLTKCQPPWVKLMRRGRSRFIDALEPNDRDAFAAAGLINFPATLDIASCWDSLSGLARLVADHEKMEQGRAAEALTLEYERKRLKQIGIEKEPSWLGLEDNFAGYDVLSYDLSSSGAVINRLIEVKSTAISPLKFIITRNEWIKASRAKDNYFFHLWHMRSDNPVLYELTVADVIPHIPINRGKGMWMNAKIPILNN